MSREDRIAANISRTIGRNQKKREQEMSETFNRQHPKTDAQRDAENKQKHDALLTRIAELEERVATLESK